MWLSEEEDDENIIEVGSEVNDSREIGDNDYNTFYILLEQDKM